MARLERIARDRFSVFRRDHARRAGVSDGALSRLQRRGLAHRIHRGVYVLGCVPSDPRSRRLAAVDACGDGAALSGVHAVVHWGITRRERAIESLDIDVVVPRRHAPVEGVRIVETRVLEAGDVTVHDGVPILAVARLLVELAALDWDEEELIEVIDQAMYRRCLDLADVERSISRHSRRRNIRRLAVALERYRNGDGGAQSAFELRNVQAIRAVLRVPYETNRRRRFGGRRRRPDLFIPVLHIAVEVDGNGHGRPTRRRDDAERDRGYRAERVTCFRIREGCELRDRRAAIEAITVRQDAWFASLSARPERA